MNHSLVTGILMISAQITGNVWLGGSINLLATVSRNDKTSNLSTDRARKVVILSASEARRTKSRASLFLHAGRTLRDPAKSLDPIVRPARVSVCIQRFAGIRRLRCARQDVVNHLVEQSLHYVVVGLDILIDNRKRSFLHLESIR